MILINVLAIVFLATTVLAIMLAGQDGDLERSRQLRSAAQAMAIARGGELSAIVALRRDLASGSTTDTLAEPWANIADRNVRIGTGNFSFIVTDAQARFNINNFAVGDAISQGNLKTISEAVGISPQRISGLILSLKDKGPITDLSELKSIGLNDEEIRHLSMFCVALPEPTTVNINTASEELLSAMLGNSVIAHNIVLDRDRAGSRGLSKDGKDILSENQLILPPGLGVSSDYFFSRAYVTVGDTSQQLTSLLHRRSSDGLPIVEAVRRWRGAAPIGAPDFSR